MLPPPDAEATAHSERLRAWIAAEIQRQGGSVPFSRFMELALYAPGLGYYSAGAAKLGVAGDFITAPELGPLFAECVANALAPVLRGLGADGCILELGGGSGAFAADVLPRLAELDALPARYAILEPSADFRERQQRLVSTRLPAALAARVEWVDGPPQAEWRGVLFANEVLDALPTPRFSLHGGEVVEEHVGLDGEGRFRRAMRPADPLLSAAVRHVEADLGLRFADGYRSELLAQLPYWLQAVGGLLAEGAMLFVDYGYPRREYYLPERHEGTLVCHYRHRAHDDPFHLPGLQDLSAFVDFTALAEAGSGAGFELAGYCAQSSFLLGNGLAGRLQARDAEPEIARHRHRLAAKRLVLPGEMGERFQVMGFQRGVAFDAAFETGDLSHRL